jgi:putative transposase
MRPRRLFAWPYLGDMTTASTNDIPLDTAIVILGMAAWINRDLYRVIDFLDGQLEALMRVMPRLPRLDRAQRQQLALLAHRIERARLEAHACIVTVDTLRRWYCTLIERKWTYPRTGPGRPPVGPAVAEQAIIIARENPGMGSPGIAQRLGLLGIHVSESTVRRILREHGIDPAPLRVRESDWQQFLEAHAHELAAIDFTTVECFENGRLATHYCLFGIHHDTRRVAFLGMTEHPQEAWMVQQARNHTAEGGFLAGRRFVIMDRDASFSARFRHVLKLGGCTSIRTPPQSPNCNAFIERYFRSLKEECLDHIIPLSPDGLRHVIAEYLVHYHTERPHQGLDGKLIDPPTIVARPTGKIRCRHRLGGILKHYYREAA